MSDSPVSIKTLTKSQRNIQIGVCAADDPERAIIMYRYETTLQTVFSTTQFRYFCHKYTYYSITGESL